MEKLAFIGDVHGCYEELIALMNKIPDDRTIVFLGDLFDRGPFSLKVLDLVIDLVKQKKAKCVIGNHCNKVYRYAKGNNVSTGGGIRTTIAELDQLTPEERTQKLKDIVWLYEHSSLYLAFNRASLVAVHGSWRDDVLNTADKRVISDVCMYGNAANRKGPDGFPVEWVDDYKGPRTVVYGHIVHDLEKPHVVGKTYGIDTGCVHGGHLTALLFPEMEFVQVKALKTYHGSKH